MKKGLIFIIVVVSVFMLGVYMAKDVYYVENVSIIDYLLAATNASVFSYLLLKNDKKDDNTDERE